MKRNSLIWFFIMSMMYVIGISLLSEHILSKSTVYEENKQHHVNVLGFEQRILKPGEWVPYFGGKEARRKIEVSNAYMNKAEEGYEEVLNYSWYFVAASIFLMMITFTMYIGSRNFARAMGLCFLVVALACLTLGITVPILELAAFNENLTIPVVLKIPDYIPWMGGEEYDFSMVFEGRTYYYYEVKSVSGLIHILFESNNFVVAIAIMTFSIIVPLLKLILSSMILLSSWWRVGVLKWFVGVIGKWSMADVFVAAAFLSYLSFNNMSMQVEMETFTLPGLYFFLTYCILSIASYYFIDKVVRDANKRKAAAVQEVQ